MAKKGSKRLRNLERRVRQLEARIADAPPPGLGGLDISDRIPGPLDVHKVWRKAVEDYGSGTDDTELWNPHGYV